MPSVLSDSNLIGFGSSVYFSLFERLKNFLVLSADGLSVAILRLSYDLDRFFVRGGEPDTASRTDVRDLVVRVLLQQSVRFREDSQDSLLVGSGDGSSGLELFNF